jgi:hypothetical protein
MKLTKLSAAWLPEWTCRLMPAPAGSDAGTASQLIPGVRWTNGGLSLSDGLPTGRLTWGARTGPMRGKQSSRQSDLRPRWAGVAFRKLACRSDACGEALVDTWRVRASTPAHDRQAHHVKGHPATPLGSRVVLGGVHGQAAWKQIRAYDWLATEQGDEADER